MAITIERAPDNIQPTYTDGLFYTISSDKTDEFKYRYIFWVYVNGEKVFKGKSTPNPEGKGVIDLSEILKTYCNSTIQTDTDTYVHNTTQYSTYTENDVIDYYVRFGEEYATSITSSVIQYNGDDNPGDPVIQTQTRKVFNGTYPSNVFSNRQDFDYAPYVLSGNPIQYQSGLFLTNSPRVMEVGTNDRGTLSFFNYWLGGDDISYGYQARYTFYDNQGNIISTASTDNLVSTGGGPLTGQTQLMYDNNIIEPQSYDFNIINVATGPWNIEQTIGLPSGTTFYQVQMFGIAQKSSSPCPVGYQPGYITSCGFGYEIPVCIPTDAISSKTRFYWPNSISQWNPDCFFISSVGGPGGETFSGGTDYGNNCGLCYQVEFGGLPANPPNITQTPIGIPPAFTAMSEVFQYNIDEDCDYWNNKQLVWKNRYGTFDYYKFQKRKGEGLNIQRQRYNQIPLDWASSSPSKTQISRGLTDFNVGINETHVINTGFVNQATMVWLEEVYTSPEVYLIETDGSLFPINITSTDYVRKNRGNKEIINLELTYTYSNNIRLN